MALRDCELIKLIREGNEQALVALYDRYSRPVYFVALRVLRNPASAEDVVQETFMQLWHCPGQVQVLGETLYGWMVVASRNRAIDILRKKCPDQLDESTLLSVSNLENAIELRLTCELLINKLNEDQQILLEMAFFKDMTHAEIASATGYPLGTIKTKIRSALAILRDGLTQSAEVPHLAISSAMLF